MECQHCGQYSDWIGDSSEWDRVNGSAGTGGLLRCSVCGNQQHKR